jgi:hypothetical protein
VRRAAAWAAALCLAAPALAWAQASDCAVATDQAIAADLKAATARSARQDPKELTRLMDLEIGRASCRERVS